MIHDNIEFDRVELLVQMVDAALVAAKGGEEGEEGEERILEYGYQT